ncbi:ribosome-associated protein [Desulfobotulus alkaliphilus]|uniref:Ribosome-associated protein n=2 Tax=Desulfobotulus alkaliphilus TaxID=622671 RepID=A0A562RHE8_9BACT|nr:ribosome-associated protein [Desulfobotulus alkaliphilus]
MKEDAYFEEDGNDEEGWDGDLPRSRSRKKQEARALEAMGVMLASMGEDVWQKLPLSPELYRALVDVKGIRSHGARKRQEKRIGSLMRHEETETVAAIARFLEDGESRKRREHSRMQYLESLRDRLASGNEGLAENLARHPGLERNHFLFLVDQAVREKTTGKPKGSRRTLFRYLNERLDGEGLDLVDGFLSDE